MEQLPRILFWLLLTVLGVTVFCIFRDYGLVWDSEVQKNYGNLVLLYYLSGGRNKTAFDYLDLQYYGGGFETLLQIAANLVLFAGGPFIFETRHLLTALTGLLGVFTAYRLGCLLGTRWTGLVAALFLALTPRYFGHMFNNSKDAPMAVFYLVALYWTIRFQRELPRPRPGTILALGAAIGFTMSIRVGGGILIVYPVIGLLLYAFTRRRNGLIAMRPALFTLIAAGALAYLLMLVFWPWAQMKPISRPLEAISIFSRFGTDAPQLFNGQFVSSREIPFEYIPVWWSVSVPEFYFILALAPLLFGLPSSASSDGPPGRHPGDGKIEVLLVTSAAMLPVAFAIARDMVLTDAIRHFLFIMPPLAVLAALTLTQLERASRKPLAQTNQGSAPLRGARVLLGIAVLLGAGLALRDMIVLHPYQVVYFNRLIGGGIPAAEKKFDFDYWGQSVKEGTEWLIANHRAEPGRVYTVACCSRPSQIEYWLAGEFYNQKDRILFRFGRDLIAPPPEVHHFLNNPPGTYKAVFDHSPPDILLATKRFDCPRKFPGRVLHVVRRAGVPLLYIIEVDKPEESHDVENTGNRGGSE